MHRARETEGQQTLLKGDCISRWPCNRKEKGRAQTASSLDRQKVVDTELGDQVSTVSVRMA